MRVILLILMMLFAAPLRGEPASDLNLLMFEQDGCYWCKRWNAEIGPAYPNTAEGQRAPLLRENINNQNTAGVALKARVNFTPTFILVQNGQEIGRIEGYPGEQFFWPLLSQQLQKTPHDVPGEETQ